MSYALLGSLIFTLTLVPVLASYWFTHGVKEIVNRPYEWFKREYAAELNWCLDHPELTMLLATIIFGASLLLIPYIGGEFMPHLDEGAMWVRATMPYTISFEEAAKVRASGAQHPDVLSDGDRCGLGAGATRRRHRPHRIFQLRILRRAKAIQGPVWNQGPIHNKAALSEDLEKRLAAYPGVIFNFTQPAEDAVDEALTGLKSALAVKIYGPDLQVLEQKAVEIKRVLQQVQGFTQLTVVRELGQPSVQIDVDREKIARYGINVSDVEGVIQAGVGGQAATQVIQGEKLFDLVVRMKPQYRSSTHDIGNLLVPTPSGQQVPISELAKITQGNGASFIYRENNSRYIGVQFSIEGRDLARAVDEAQKAVKASVALPPGLHTRLGRRIQRIRRGAAAIRRHRSAGAFC